MSARAVLAVLAVLACLSAPEAGAAGNARAAEHARQGIAQAQAAARARKAARALVRQQAGRRLLPVPVARPLSPFGDKNFRQADFPKLPKCGLGNLLQKGIGEPREFCFPPSHGQQF